MRTNAVPGRREGFRTVLFDADGTLFDYARAEASSLEGAYTEFGGPWHPGLLSLYERINADLWREFEQGRISSTLLRRERFVRFCRESGTKSDPARLADRYLELLAGSSFLIDGAEEVVRRLRRGRLLAIVTNGFAEVQRSRIAGSPLAGLFDTVVISEEVGAQKPDAEIFRIAFERLGTEDRTSAIMVGDSLTSDIQGGVNFGIATCLLDPDGRHAPVSSRPGGGEGRAEARRQAEHAATREGRPGPDWVISSLTELLPIVED